MVSLQNCPECNQTGVPSSTVSCPWPQLGIYTYSCTKCDLDWAACIKCHEDGSGQRKHFRDPTSASRHLRRHESTPLAAPLAAEHVQGGSHSPSPQVAMAYDTNWLVTLRQQSLPFDIHDAPIAIENYIRKGGDKWLIGRALRTDFKPDTACLPMSDNEISYHIRLAYVAGSMSRNMRGLFAALLVQVWDKSRRNVTSVRRLSPLEGPTSPTILLTASHEQDPTIDIPINSNVFRRRYISGKNSILANIPIPPPYIKHGHAVVRFRDVLTYLLGILSPELQPLNFGSEPSDGIRSEIHHTRKAKQLVKVAFLHFNDEQKGRLIVIPVLFWSDEFDPGSSAMMGRASVWVYTVTIGLPKKHQNQSFHTFPIAISTKTCNHEPIIRMFDKEIKDLQDPRSPSFYFAQVEGNVHLYPAPFASLHDTPEKREFNGIVSSAGNMMKMWRQVCDINNEIVYNRLPSCDACSTCRLQATTEVSQCAHCADWDPNGASGKMYLVGLDSHIKPHEVTYRKLIRKVTEAVGQLLDGTLNTPKKFEDYCGQEAVKPSVAEGLYDLVSSNQGLAEELKTYTYGQLREYLIINELLPATWTGIRELRDFLDCPMHLLFLRITKETVAMVVAWLATRKEMSTFAREDGKKLNDIIDLRLPCFRIRPFKSGGFGGWISSDYVTLARVSPWLFVDISKIPDKEPYVQPTHHYTKWTVLELQSWLASRGLPKAGLKQELLDKVDILMKRDEGPPQVNQMVVSPEEIMLLVVRLNQMITLLMCEEFSDEHVQHCRTAIKLFLDTVHKVDFKLRNGVGKPKWYSMGNYMNLLNLPDQILRYGSLRLFWEGIFQGEAILRLIKPLVKSVNRKDWHLHALTRFYKQKTMARILSRLGETHLDDIDLTMADNDEGEEDDQDSDNESAVHPENRKEETAEGDPFYQNYYKYRDPSMVQELVHHQSVISTMYVNHSHQFYCRVAVDVDNNKPSTKETSRRRHHRFVRVNLEFRSYHVALEENLFSLTLDQDDTTDFDEQVGGDSCLLLPIHNEGYLVCAYSSRKATNMSGRLGSLLRT